LEEKKIRIIDELVNNGVTSNKDYYDSGLPWLPPVPGHWKVQPLRAYLEHTKRLVGKDSNKYNLLSLTKGGVILRDLSEMKGKFPASFDTYQRVEPGDFIFCLFAG
jgi:type I restriction enzyme S subunit